MRALIAVSFAAALTVTAPGVAGAEHSCAPAPPKSSQYSTGTVPTPAGAAVVRGGPDHVGVQLGASYLFADGDANGGYLYGQAAVDGDVGPYHVVRGPEFRVGGQSAACTENYR